MNGKILSILSKGPRKKDLCKIELAKFQKKLFKRFKKLYYQRKLPMTQTAMCWGLQCGPGWNNLLWDLSYEIENALKEEGLYNKQYIVSQQVACTTSKDIERHGGFKYVPIFRTRFKLIANLYHGLKNATKNILVIHEEKFGVTTVKEKYGTLSYYVNNATDKIDKIIDKYEAKSEFVCERCGIETGESNLKGDNWIYNMCDQCWFEFKNKKD